MVISGLLQNLYYKGQKDPQQDQQVHNQKDAVDQGKGGISPLCPNIIVPVSVLALAKLALNRFMRCR